MLNRSIGPKSCEPQGHSRTANREPCSKFGSLGHPGFLQNRALSGGLQCILFNVAGTTHTSLWVSVYYVAVRTIVLSRHGSNLARPVIIHDIIHSLICMPSTPHCGFSGVSPDGNCAWVHWGFFTSNSKSVRRAIWFTWFSEPHGTTSLLVYTAPGSPRRSPIQLWTGRDVA